jgi:tripartite-type tricarboxylate transporter receptor subunit TctC
METALALASSGVETMWRRRLVALAVIVIGAHGSAAAQVWPSKPIRAIVPFGAGSATDIVPRIVFGPLSGQLGQPIIVENRAGAGSSLGTAAVAKADPDGHTLLATSSAHTITPAVYATLSYDAAADFAAITPFGSVANVLVISPDKGFKTIQEMIAAAKAKPGSFNYASVGVGSATHLSVERLKLSAGFEAVHVPFRGGPEALTEVMAGRVEFYFCPINTALPFIREGKLLGLVVNSTKRAAALPDVPTVIEAGYRDAEFPIWLGLLAPAQTPRDIVNKLHTETVKALQTPSTQEKLAKAGIEPLTLSPVEFDARIRQEIATNGALAKVAGIKPN